MKDAIFLLVQLFATIAKLLKLGGSRSVIAENLLLKQRNPRYGCPRIAQQINLAFGLNLDKDIVRRVLALHYRSQ
jgi:hypothetical protein